MLALSALTLRELHILHQALQLFQRLLRFGHAALFHQFLNTVHHGLQVVLTHLHATLGHVLTVLHRPVAHRLLRHLVHVVLRSVPQFLHQLGDLLVRCTVLHRLRKTFARAFQTFQRAAKIAFFQDKRQIPQSLRDLVALVWLQSVARCCLQPPQDHPQPEIGRLGPKKSLFGTMRYGAQHLRHTRGIVRCPEQVAPLFDHRIGKRVEEPPRGQVYLLWPAGALQTRSISDG